MACCGKKREHWLSATRNEMPGGVPQGPPPLGSATPRAVHFKYLGSTGLTVVGPVSGQTYRFSGPGAVAAVDPRDAPSVAAVPRLVRVQHP